MTFTWLKHARPSTKWGADIGGMSRGSYPSRVTVNRYNGYIRGTNISVLHLLSPLCMLKQLCENLHTLEHTAKHLFDGLDMAKSQILLNGQSHVKVMLRHVSGRVALQASVLGYKLVTWHAVRQHLYA